MEVLRDAVGGELDGRKGIAQALFDQSDGKVGDVDADPTPPEFFRRMDGGRAAAELALRVTAASLLYLTE